MFSRITIPITDQNYLELLKKIEAELDQILAINEHALVRYCRYVEELSKEPKEYYRSSIILIWREAIELFDSIESLILSSSCNTIPILLRSLFELYLGISFIFEDDNLIKQRALAYDGVHILRKIENYKKYDPKNQDYTEFRDSLGTEITSKFNKNFNYQGAIDNLNAIFEKYPDYKEFKQEYDRVFKGKPKKTWTHIKWYELFGGKSSIYSLAEMLEMKRYYITLYNQFSLKGHGNDAMSAWEPHALKNPKVPNLKSLANDIDLTLTFISGITANILEHEHSADYRWYAKKHSKFRDNVEKLSQELQTISLCTKKRTSC